MKASISTDKLWFVVRTNIKSEAKATSNLRDAGYEVYYPRRRVEKWNKRTNTYRTKEYALMQRYIFIGTYNPNLDTARSCEGVERILGDFEYHTIAVNPQDVEALYLAEVDMRFDDTRAARKHRQEAVNAAKAETESKFPSGTQVKITEGPFAELHGIVERITRDGNVKLLMSLFGRMTSTEFMPDQLMHNPVAA